uniref:Lipocalin/cytosolic fatty-acid binding domain-containing protein n=1 Tax=Sus scrofa TaxID=9823 RepID=A0A8D1FR25_PIG
MKILLLSLVLGLACVQEPQTEQDPTQRSRISGKWKTLYVAASNREKTSENGPFHAYMCWIHFENGNNKIFFKFFVKVNGKCVELTTKGTKTDNKAYDDVDCEYGGKYKFKGIHVSENALIGYNENVDDEGKIPKMTALFGKGNKIQDEDLEKFKELMREKGIPEESMVSE